MKRIDWVVLVINGEKWRVKKVKECHDLELFVNNCLIFQWRKCHAANEKEATDG